MINSGEISQNKQTPAVVSKPAKTAVHDIQDLNKDDLAANLRPTNLQGYVGQSKLKKQLNLILESAKKRQALPEHILLYGNPGLGKTTLAHVLADELDADFKVVSGPALQRIGDIVSLILNCQSKTVLFIDEIHRLRTQLEEILYTVMEDRQVDLVMGKGAGAKPVRLDVPEICIIGATTLLGKLSKPLKDRFPTIFQLQVYSQKELVDLLENNAKKLDLNLAPLSLQTLAARSRGVPRIANNLLKRLRDFQVVHQLALVDEIQTEAFLQEIGVFDNGLTEADFVYLKALVDGVRGINTLASVVQEDPQTLELVIEPYLLHLGYVEKTPTGRKITLKGEKVLQSL